MTDRIAAIDIGTNTALLLIAEQQSAGLSTVRQIEKVVRLGEGVDESRMLQEAAMQRVLSALERYIELSQAMRCKRIVITGTSAVRDAANQQELVKAVRSRFGLHLQVLSGDEEARLTYLGAVSNKELQGKTILLDIGGGSTEFILGHGSEIRQAVSLDIGSVRLTERFIRHDPVTDEEFQNLVSGIRNEFEKITCLQTSGLQNFIGVAGTITTLAAMQLKMTQYQADLIDNCLLTVAQIDDLAGQLRMRTVVEKKQLPGLNPKRADVILAGAVILREAMNFFGFEQVLVSDRGLRYGVAIKALTDADLSA